MENASSIGELATACCPTLVHSRMPLISASSAKYRDIKPDNILLDEQGHAHLTDFNIAVHCSERRMLTGVAGSMAYMAPEILVKKGYAYTIDWWSLGVCMYELIFGRRPFRGRTNGDLTHSITKDPLRFPDDAEMRCSQRGMKLLSSFLERDITKRLGCKPDAEGLEEIRDHPWFSSIDWDKLENKQLQPPFVPDVRLLCSSLVCILMATDFDRSFVCSPRGQTSMLRTSWKSCFWTITPLRPSTGKRTSPRCRLR